MKRHESNQKEPDVDMKNWGKTQGDRHHQSWKGCSQPEVQEQILTIPSKIPEEVFDLKTIPEETANESKRDD